MEIHMYENVHFDIFKVMELLTSGDEPKEIITVKDLQALGISYEKALEYLDLICQLPEWEETEAVMKVSNKATVFFMKIT